MRPMDGNVFAGITVRSAEEQLTDLVKTPGLKIERIVSTGQTSAPDIWLEQAQSEWVLLISGAAAILFEGEAEARRLKPGDYLMIPPHCRHRVIWTDPDEPSVWLAVHFDERPPPDDL